MVVTYQYVKPGAVELKIGDVSIWMDGAFAALYRLFEWDGNLDKFLEEAKPYYWKKYVQALRTRQEIADRKQKLAEQAAENRLAKDAEKSRIRRQKNKIGTNSPVNADPTPERDHTIS